MSHYKEHDSHESAPTHCANCKHTFAEGDKYCSNCSQKRHIHLDMGHLVHEFIHNTLHLDGKFFRMLHHIFVPGKVTNDFFAGKQKMYPHPVRFFIVVSGLFLLTMLAAFGDGMSEGFTTVSNDGAGGLKGVYKPVLGPTLSFATRAESFFADSTGRALPPGQLDSLYFEVFGLQRDSTLLLITQDAIKGKGFNITFSDGVLIKDMFVMDPDSLMNRYDLDQRNPIKRTITRQGIKATQEPSGLVKRYLGNFAFSLITMVLLQALALKMLYIRKKRLYAEHVIFLMHQAVVALLSIFLVHLICYVVPDAAATLAGVWCLWFLLFGFASFKAVYKQSFAKTGLKYFIYCWSYFLVAIIVLILNLIIAILILS